MFSWNLLWAVGDGWTLADDDLAGGSGVFAGLTGTDSALAAVANRPNERLPVTGAEMDISC